ncbi:MAG: hypothetical protein RPU51_04515 [Candidatus Sedimenticola sp. (ex Thyasira tokunagai)]
MLEFKRKFVLSNLDRVKSNKDRIIDNCENSKKWLITVWLGTIIFVSKNSELSENLLGLLLLEVFLFYVLETIFRYHTKRHSWRIFHMEKWIMKATEDEIVSLEGPLALVTPSPTTSDDLSFMKNAIKDKYSYPYYLVMGVFSGFVYGYIA